MVCRWRAQKRLSSELFTVNPLESQAGSRALPAAPRAKHHLCTFLLGDVLERGGCAWMFVRVMCAVAVYVRVCVCCVFCVCACVFHVGALDWPSLPVL